MLLSNLVFEDCWSCGDLVKVGGFKTAYITIRKLNLYLGYPPENRANPICSSMNLRVPYTLTQSLINAR